MKGNSLWHIVNALRPAALQAAALVVTAAVDVGLLDGALYHGVVRLLHVLSGL